MVEGPKNVAEDRDGPLLGTIRPHITGTTRLARASHSVWNAGSPVRTAKRLVSSGSSFQAMCRCSIAVPSRNKTAPIPRGLASNAIVSGPIAGPPDRLR